jgi:hypothetical protein
LLAIGGTAVLGGLHPMWRDIFGGWGLFGIFLVLLVCASLNQFGHP